MQIDLVKSYLLQLQDSIYDALATEDSAATQVRIVRSGIVVHD